MKNIKKMCGFNIECFTIVLGCVSISFNSFTVLGWYIAIVVPIYMYRKSISVFTEYEEMQGNNSFSQKGYMLIYLKSFLATVITLIINMTIFYFVLVLTDNTQKNQTPRESIRTVLLIDTQK